MWYESQRKGLGLRFINDVGNLMDHIATNPEQFSAIAWGIRRVLMKRFPYAAYFAVSGHLISIIAVSHQSRHPSLWNSAVNFLQEPTYKPWPVSGIL